MVAWRGNTYLDRPGAAQTYEEASARARRLKARNWRHYLELAPRHNLPTQPQTLWPDEWEAGGRYTGYLGTGFETVDIESLLSAMQLRQRLSIGHKTWKMMSEGLKPAAAVSHKLYYDPDAVREHFLNRLDLMTKSDCRESLRAALEAL